MTLINTVRELSNQAVIEMIVMLSDGEPDMARDFAVGMLKGG